MPYPGELASKTTHSDIVRNPEVAEFLKGCDYLKIPSDAEGRQVAQRFVEPPAGGDLPRFIIAVDGSSHEASIDDQLPSTKVGYIRIGAVLIDLEKFGSLRVGNFVDPFRVADLQNSNTGLVFTIPSANIRWGDHRTVRESFRAWLDHQFDSPSTRFKPNDPFTSLRATLFFLASQRSGELGTNNPNLLKIFKCPVCGQGPVEIPNSPEAHHCPFCQSPVYPTDCLRLWEEIQENQSNQAALNRLMLTLEHLIPFHYMYQIYKQSPLILSKMAFFIDGPLAVFGPPAWLHHSFMTLLDKVNKRLQEKNCDPLLVIGLQKTGQIVDHINLIERFVSKNRIFAIDDDYRYQYILPGRDPSSDGFGSETYYGQDFILKTPSGRSFSIGLPYPFASKKLSGASFVREKVKLENYPQLPQAVKLINLLESDLYENAVVPIALAHHYTAISLEPGGKVLDLLTRRAMNRE